MIPYNPIHSFNIGPITLQVWGLIVGIAYLVGMNYVLRKAKNKTEKKHFENLGLIAMLGGIVGARMGYVIFNLNQFTSLLDLFAVWNGGMAFFGGLITSIVLILIYLKIHKLNLWKTLDALAPAVALGHAIGRVGCLLTGLHIGKVTNVPWAVLFQGQPRHPTPAYSIIHLLILFFILKKLQTKKLFTGAVALVYLIWYSVGRFIIEFFRIDLGLFGLTYTQWLTFGIIIISLIVFVKKASEHNLSFQDILKKFVRQ